MLENLNENQKRAVISTSPYIRIIAGAGSGKTRVLTTRVAFLIDSLGVDPKKIVAITFTNKAANEMKSRIANILETRGVGVHVSTIHSLCVRILREDIACMDMPKNFTVLDQDDQKTILKEAYKERGIEAKTLSYSAMLDYIANNKVAGVSYEHALNIASGLKKEKDKAEVYRYYLERQKSMYALDFDDLLLWTVRMFKLFSEKLQKWQYRFQYIMVDEFQDIDNVQYELISQLAGATNQVYVVGDPDQTIYTWRGANVNIIMHFEKDFTPCETIVLDENYRSTPMILRGANSVIKNNRNRLEKELYSRKQDGDRIQHYSAISEEQEALWISQQILNLHKEGNDYRDIAILYRANYLSRAIEKALRDFNVPYIIYGGIRFYDRAEVKDILSYLRMLVASDDLSLKRVMNVPRRGLGNKTADTLLDEARKNNETMYEVMKNANPFSGKVGNTIKEFVNQIENWKERLEGMELDKVLEMVFEESGYRALLEANKEDDRVANVKELMNDLHDFMINYPESDLAEYLQMINLYTERADIVQADFVQLMTIHAAKGLEFSQVFVCGLSEGVFPSERTLQEGSKGLEEERRLAYVAYTRAKDKLYLSESQGFSFVLSKSRTPSRFINEIEDDYVEHIGHPFAMKESSSVPFQPFSMSNSEGKKPSKPLNLRPGDMVVHDVFNEGIVIKVDGGLVDIAFSHPHGVKTIMAHHPSIHKK